MVRANLDPAEDAEDVALAAIAVVHRPGELAGALPGEMSVGGDGQLSYVVPIEVAPGRLGMEPSVSLVYSSTAGNGPVGISWSIGGLSQISRCPRTIHHDGYARGVTFDELDAFCLDGERLDCVGAGCEDGPTAEYRTRHDSYARITRFGPANDVSGWLIEHRSGNYSCYGHAASAPQCQPATGELSGATALVQTRPYAMVDERTDTFGTAGPEVDVAWLLSTVSDRSGNTVHYTYDTNPPSADVLEAAAVDRRVLQIEYTAVVDGNRVERGSRLVRFEYETRPDAVDSYANGIRYLSRQRLARLVIEAPIPGGDISTRRPWWTYELAYEDEPFTGRSRLASVTRCDGEYLGTRASCLAPTRFTYENMSEEWVVRRTGIRAGADPNLETQAQVGDLDGDGRDDLVFYRGWISECAAVGDPNGGSDNRWTVPWNEDRRVLPTVPEPFGYVADPSLAGQACGQAELGRLAYRGEWVAAFGSPGGLEAAAGLGSAADGQLGVDLTAGTVAGARTFVARTSGRLGYASPFVLDVSRDGLADVVPRYPGTGEFAPVVSLASRRLTFETNRVRVGSLTNLFERWGALGTRYWGELDGDGLPDTFGWLASESVRADGLPIGCPRQVGPFCEGIGAQFSTSGPAYLHDELESARVTDDDAPFTDPTFGDARPATYVIDVDGDGMDEVVYPVRAREVGDEAQYRVWDPSSDEPVVPINLAQNLPEVASFNIDQSRWLTMHRFADVNGDGLQDFVSFGGRDGSLGERDECPYTLCARLSSGRGFGPWQPLVAPGTTYAVPRQVRPLRPPADDRPDRWYRPVNDDGIRVLDWNGDGRADFLVPYVTGTDGGASGNRSDFRTWTTRTVVYFSTPRGYEARNLDEDGAAPRCLTTGSGARCIAPTVGPGTVGFREDATGFYNPLGDVRRDCGREHCCDDALDCYLGGAAAPTATCEPGGCRDTNSLCSADTCDDRNGCTDDACSDSVCTFTPTAAGSNCLDPSHEPQILGYTARVGDFDGDGLDDIAYLDYAYGTVSPRGPTAAPEWVVQLRRGRRGSLLRSVTNGLGAVDRARWRSLVGAPDLYTPGDTAAYAGTARRSLRRGLVVSEMRLGDAIGSAGRYVYSYRNGVVDLEGAGFLGFRSTRALDAIRRNEVETTFGLDERPSDADDPVDRRAYYLRGRVLRTFSRAQVGTGTEVASRITEELVDYGPRPTFRGSTHVYETLPRGARSITYEEGARRDVAERVSVETTYDLYEHGQPRLTTTETRGRRFGVEVRGDFAQVAHELFHDEDDWIIARPRVTLVIHNTAESGRADDPNPERREGGTFTTRTFDALGRVETETRGLGTEAELTTTLGYDEYGLVTSVTGVDPDGPVLSGSSRTLTIEYDGEHYLPRRLTNELGHETAMLVHPAYGVPVVERDANDLRVTSVIDTLGRPVAVLAPGVPQATAEYTRSSSSRPLGITLAQEGSPTQYAYFDALGRVREERTVVLDRVAEVVTTYDAAGRVATVSEPRDAIAGVRRDHRFVYDGLDRTVRAVRPDGTRVTGTYRLFRTIFTDARGVQTERLLDVNGRVAQSEEGDAPTASDGAITRYFYGSFGRLRWIEDPLGADTTLEHDDYGRLVRRVDPDSGARRFVYDGFDELRRMGDDDPSDFGSGEIDIEIERDPIGRVIHTREESGEAFFDWDDSADLSRGRDLVGAIHASWRTLPGGTERLAEDRTFFDEHGRPIAEEVVVGGDTLTADFGYDALGRLASITYPEVPPPPPRDPPIPARARYRASYEYAESARGGYLRRVRGGPVDGAPTTLMTVETRDLYGRIAQDALGNGLVERRTFDVLGRLEELNVRPASTGAGSSRTVMNLGYEYDAEGNVIQRSDTAPGVDRVDVYALDALGRMTGWTRTECRGSVAAPCIPGRVLRDTSYDYDIGGNLLGTRSLLTTPGLPSRATSETYSIAGAHRLSRLTARESALTEVTRYSHDEHGRRTAEWPGVDRPPSVTTAYTAFDLPLTVSTPSGIESYTYDAGGSRVGRDDSTGTSTRYLGELFELRREGNTVYGVIQVPGEEAVVASVVQSSLGTSGLRTLYTHRDQLGTASVITNETGAVVERQHFEPFGGIVDVNARPSTAPRATPLTDDFTGHERDRLTGYVNARGRIYDPSTRRFLTSDPLVGWSGSQSWNPFGYVNGNPSTFSDPSGFAPVRLSASLPNQGGCQGADCGGGGGGGGARGGGTVARGSDAPVRLGDGPSRIDDASSSSGPQIAAATPPAPDWAIVANYAARRIAFDARDFGLDAARMASNAAEAMAPVAVAGLVLVVGSIPPVGEGMDVYTAFFDPDVEDWERALALVTLAASAESFGLLPNMGPMVNARRAYRLVARAFHGLGDSIRAASGLPPALAQAAGRMTPPPAGMADEAVEMASHGSGGAGVRVGDRAWRRFEPGDPAIRSGCERVARAIQRTLGGEIRTIRPPHGGRYLGGVRNSAGRFVNPAGDVGHGGMIGWDSHTFVLRDGRVYDALTGPAGMTTAEYRALWEYQDVIDFGAGF